MKYLQLSSLLFLFLCSTTVLYAQDHGFGMGFMAGEPTGISAKVWLNDVNAIDLGFGWSVGGYGLDKYDVSTNNDTRFHIHADIVRHDFGVIQAGERLPVYYGLGLRLNSGAGYSNSIGVRGVGGIDWLPRGTPIDIFLEAAPVFQFNPSTRFGLNGGIGGRYFFGQ